MAQTERQYGRGRLDHLLYDPELYRDKNVKETARALGQCERLHLDNGSRTLEEHIYISRALFLNDNLMNVNEGSDNSDGHLEGDLCTFCRIRARTLLSEAKAMLQLDDPIMRGSSPEIIERRNRGLSSIFLMRLKNFMIYSSRFFSPEEEKEFQAELGAFEQQPENADLQNRWRGALPLWRSNTI